jgi:hypothetical protein
MRGVVERWRGQFVKSGAGKLNKYYFAERRHWCYFFDLRLLHSRQLNILFTLPHIRPAAEPAGPGLELKLASYLGRVLVFEGARKATEHRTQLGSICGILKTCPRLSVVFTHGHINFRRLSHSMLPSNSP